MTFLLPILLFLIGLSVLHSFAARISILEKIGMSLPIGMGVASVVVFILSLFHIPLNSAGLYVVIFLVIIAGLTALKLKDLKSIYTTETVKKEFQVLPLNFGWMFLVGVILYVFYAISSKTLFWPTFIYDSIYGYDFIGKLMNVEGRLDSTIFDPDNPMYSVRSVYPPLFPINLGLAYVFGYTSSKIVITWFFGSLIISFYALIKKYNSHLAAALFTLILIMTPEMVAFSALSSPNPPCSFYSAIGLICAFIWFDKEEQHYFWLSAVLLSLAVWTRSEAIVFAAGGGVLFVLKGILYYMEKPRKMDELKKILPKAGIYAAMIGVTFISWSLFTKYYLEASNEQLIAETLQLDMAKLGRLLSMVMDITLDWQFYGLSVYLFVFAVPLGIAWAFYKKDKHILILGGIIIFVWLLNMAIYNQLDVTYLPDDGRGKGLINSGYKRGLFYYIPAFLFFAANIEPVRTFFTKFLALTKKEDEQ